ncbi:MAG TPA: glycosyltransferase family 2 protein [Bryobacteraceae bacterium]|jgi:glycosyltransferase involved in cell wall biosynthesis|nr:glycosyltransferase family 2 protein [Bryobacteraceae bacterium]
MKMVSVVTPCFNEEANVIELSNRVRAVFEKLPQYRYEHIFIDNASRDNTLAILKHIAGTDPCVKVIANSRNFGHLRSPMHGMFQAGGDAVILLFSDLQDPPEMLTEMIARWEDGTPVVLAIKETSDENGLMFWLRTKYYRLVNRLADLETYENFTGFGLYDRRVIEIVRSFNDPYPYFRGMIAEIGLPHVKIVYRQGRRMRGITKNNFYTLWDLAMLGITNFSKVPLRLLTFFGFGAAVLSVLFSLGYLVYKLLFWNRFSVGIAPLVIGIFFIGSVQLICIGIVGEYIGAIHTQIMRRPLVVEKERINFSSETPEANEVVTSAASRG